MKQEIRKKIEKLNLFCTLTYMIQLISDRKLKKRFISLGQKKKKMTCLNNISKRNHKLFVPTLFYRLFGPLLFLRNQMNVFLKYKFENIQSKI